MASPFDVKRLAEPVGERQALGPRAQQDLGRAQRAGRQDDDVGGDEIPVPAMRVGLGGHGPHAPAVLLVARQRQHAHAGEDLGAEGGRVGDVGRAGRRLGADVAAAAAVAALDASFLVHAGGVGPALVGHVQGDGLYLTLEGRGRDA